MGIAICDNCIKKYYPKRKLKSGMTGLGWERSTCAKCGENRSWHCRGYYGSELKDWEKEYRVFTGWLPLHRRTQGKRKGIKCSS